MSESSSSVARSARSFFVSVGSLVSARMVLALSQILVLPIVARLLSIEDFALMAMAMSVVVFSSVLSDAGLGRSLIRSKNMSDDDWSSVFWLLVGIGVGLFCAVQLIAPLAAHFYGEPAVWPLLSVLAIVPLCQAISAAPNAEIERRENYTGIARVQMITTVVSFSAAIALAFAGAGVWALVAQQVMLAVVRLIGILSLSRFRPKAVFVWSLLGPHLVFARDALTSSAISAASAQAGVVAIGKLLGTAPLGLYAMSQRFSRLPQFGLAGPMSVVVYVRMSKAQDDPARLIDIYLGSMRLLALLLIPPLAFIAVAGDAVFSVFLSEEWRHVAPVFALSIPGLAFEAITIVCLACLFRACGRTDLLVRLTFEGAILRIALVFIAAHISLQAVAASLTIWGLLYVPRGWALARRVVPLRTRDCLRVLALPVGITALFVVLFVILIGVYAPGEPVEVLIAIAFSLMAIGATALIERKPLGATIHIFKD
ncbi:MAG: oligosaccharide flippase family protein [Rhodobacteraceae bacterium]|nr:oligosaccharide flippase family protein [Paracoccaceae bacterium]